MISGLMPRSGSCSHSAEKNGSRSLSLLSVNVIELENCSLFVAIGLFDRLILIS